MMPRCAPRNPCRDGLPGGGGRAESLPAAPVGSSIFLRWTVPRRAGAAGQGGPWGQRDAKPTEDRVTMGPRH